MKNVIFHREPRFAKSKVRLARRICSRINLMIFFSSSSFADIAVDQDGKTTPQTVDKLRSKLTIFEEFDIEEVEVTNDDEFSIKFSCIWGTRSVFIEIIARIFYYIN